MNAQHWCCGTARVRRNMVKAEGILGSKKHSERPGRTGGIFVGNVKERYFRYVQETTMGMRTKKS